MDIMSGRQEITFREALTACLQLSDCFLSLHARGLCYRDISFGNVLIDPSSGGTLIVDNDNVAVEGEAPPGIRGTGSFMAPEVICGRAHPSAATDLYSLAVLLFYLLIMHHPLEGQRMARLGVLGQAEMRELYGMRPVFVFDPRDRSNAPDPLRDANALAFWPLYPPPLPDLFTQAFTVGLHHPDRRVRESQWRECMAQLLDLIAPCRCGADVFLRRDGQPTAACWRCGSTNLAEPRHPRLVLGEPEEERMVILHIGKQLYGHHLGGRPFDYQIPRARVERHPHEDQVIGLRNLGTETWSATAANGEQVLVLPSRAVRIEEGVSIRFGSVTGRVEA
jgi:serine/threonine protein kinase